MVICVNLSGIPTPEEAVLPPEGEHSLTMASFYFGPQRREYPSRSFFYLQGA
jgi:hypothetical protein